jgi:hypothetical protein
VWCHSSVVGPQHVCLGEAITEYEWRSVGRIGFGPDSPDYGWRTRTGEPDGHVAHDHLRFARPRRLFERAAPRDLTAAERQLAESDNRFGLKLFRALSEDSPGENVFISPLSISMALGMTLNGAAGETFDAMRGTLRFQGLEQEEINRAYHDLLDLLLRLDPGVELLVANSAWARLGWPFHDDFFTAIQTWFDAQARELDFTDSSSVNAINEWAKEKTKGRIPTVLDEIDRCVKEWGFIAVYVSPDPTGKRETPGMHELYWYPLYEKCQRDSLPIIVHGTNNQDPRIGVIPQNYQTGFLIEQYLCTQLMGHSDVFDKFPELKVVVAADDHVGVFPALRPGRPMLAEVRPDGVIVCVNSTFHARVAVELLDAGYHVYLEKPSCNTLAEAKAMLEASRRNQRHCMTAYKKRFAPAYVKAKQIIHGQEFGDPVLLLRAGRSQAAAMHGLRAGDGNGQDTGKLAELHLIPFVRMRGRPPAPARITEKRREGHYLHGRNRA